MLIEILQYLRCPVTNKELHLTVINRKIKFYDGLEFEIINDGLLFGDDFCFPIINGIPRLLVESFIDYEKFLSQHASDFEERKQRIYTKYGDLIKYVLKKNRHTKKSFEQEWDLFNYEKDTTWNADKSEMIIRFLREVDESKESIKSKIILDAGCGNGLLNNLIANNGAIVLGIEFSLSIEKAFEKNTNKNAWFIQADVQFPPFAYYSFDIVHCSGVLICTNNTETSFNILTKYVNSTGKLSVWLYHPRKDFIHNCFNFLRKYTSKLHLKFQYYLYLIFLLPPTYIIKKIKGNPQNWREMMVDILDWMTPEFRWEHTPDEATSWFVKNNFLSIKITTKELFGFNIIGKK